MGYLYALIAVLMLIANVMTGAFYLTEGFQSLLDENRTETMDYSCGDSQSLNAPEGQPHDDDGRTRPKL